MKRQHGLGGVDVVDTKPYFFATKTWKQQNLLMRKAMIEDFYRYVNDSKGYGITKWSLWFAIHGTAQKYAVAPIKLKKKKGGNKKKDISST